MDKIVLNNFTLTKTIEDQEIKPKNNCENQLYIDDKENFIDPREKIKIENNPIVPNLSE